MSSKHDLQIESRLTRLEEGQARIEGVLDEIKTNHIAHLDSKMWWGVTLAIIILAGLVVDLALRLWQ